MGGGVLGPPGGVGKGTIPTQSNRWERTKLGIEATEGGFTEVLRDPESN